MSDEQKDYVQFLANLQPTQIGLKTSSARINRTSYWNRIRTDKSLRRIIAPNYALQSTTKDSFEVTGSMSLTVGTEGEEPVVYIDCEFDGHFHVAREFTESLARRFAVNESRIFFWPYFREFVSSITGRMAIPPLVMPLTLRQEVTTKPQESVAAGPRKRATRTRSQKKR